MTAEKNDFEIWGGVECSFVRVGDEVRDQLKKSGHDSRISDLDLFKSLGIKALRYPVLWERVAPNGVESANWEWTDRRLERLQELGIRPIAGLLHGTGPFYTSLLDRDFPEKFADYSYAVARRYPDIEFFNPINEPLTSARFCGLYGHWYPHRKTDLDFVTMLFNQVHAVMRGMEAIRSVNPKAKLIQTEDLAMTLSTKPLRYQAEFENHRRWLTYDLLCGKLCESHPLMSYLRWAGATDEMMAPFFTKACPPDILGLDHYVTSVRFLDHRYHLYGPEVQGGNGRHRYADVDAVRVEGSEHITLEVLLDCAWNRYDIPLALTEVHLSCTPDEQIRWLWEVWNAAQSVRERGVDIRAMTVWALLGLHDWDTVLTRDRGVYDPGVFDLSTGDPKETPLGEAVRKLATGKGQLGNVIQGHGWWKRPDRIVYQCPPHLFAA